MSIKLRPESYEQAFDFGDAVVVLFFQTECCWCHGTNLDEGPPDVIEQCFAQLQASAQKLRPTVPGRLQARLFDPLFDRITVAQQEYGEAWGTSGHRTAVAEVEAILAAYPESEFDVAQGVLEQDPWPLEPFRLLRKSTIDLVDSLQPTLRSLARLGELIAKPARLSVTDPDADKACSKSRLSYITVDINGQIESQLRKVRKQLPFLKEIKCNLTKADIGEAFKRLDALRKQILNAIRKHESELGTRKSDGQPRKLKKCEVLALNSYIDAGKRMPDSSGSKKNKVIWDWLKQNSSDEYTLPNYETWSRHLRAAGKYYRDVQAAKRRPSESSHNSQTGRSVISQDEHLASNRHRENQ